jgi:uncharacterized protein
MANRPIILVLVHNTSIGQAIAAYESQFDIRYALDFLKAQSGDYQSVVTQIADMHPMLIVVELDTPAPWLAAVRSDPATRRIPVIAIAADSSTYQRSAMLHINSVFTPAEFIDGLPSVLTQHIKQSDQTAMIETQCDEPMSALVLKGLEQFNAQEFFECHETLEAAWNQEAGAVRDLYRAILQVAVAYYHIERGNYNGAHKLFVRTLQWFAPFPDQCHGINVAQLRSDAAAAREHLERLGSERIAEFDKSLLKPIQYEGRES